MWLIVITEFNELQFIEMVFSLYSSGIRSQMLHSVMISLIAVVSSIYEEMLKTSRPNEEGNIEELCKVHAIPYIKSTYSSHSQAPCIVHWLKSGTRRPMTHGFDS